MLDLEIVLPKLFLLMHMYFLLKKELIFYLLSLQLVLYCVTALKVAPYIVHTANENFNIIIHYKTFNSKQQ